MVIKRSRSEFKLIDIFQLFTVLLFLALAGAKEFMNYVPQRVWVILAGVSLACSAIIILRWKIGNAALLVHIGLMILFVTRNNYFLQNGQYLILLEFIAIFVMAYVSDRSIKWVEVLFFALRFAYIFYAVCTIAFYFMPEFYLGTVVELFPETKRRLIQWYYEGCMAGLTGHYSTNAMYITCGIMMEISTLAGSKKIKKSKFLVVAILLGALLLTGKRAHIVFCAIALFAVYWYYNSKQNRVLKTMRLIVFVLCGAIVVFTMIPALSVVVTRFLDHFEEGTVLNNRDLFWKLAISTFLKNPIIGIGWSQFINVSKTQLEIEAHTHNIYLQMLCELGIIGFAVFITWMIKNLKNSIALLKKARLDWDKVPENIRSLIIFSLGFQVFFLLYGISGNPIYDTEILIPYIMACSITIYFGKGLLKNRKVLGKESVEKKFR